MKPAANKPNTLTIEMVHPDRVVRCPLCGREVDQPLRGRPREYHPECKKVRNYLDAAQRALDEIEFAEGDEGMKNARMLRNELFNIANELPISRHAARGNGGRFAPKS